MRALILLLILALPATARAEKSEDLALGLSLGGTALSVAAIYAGHEYDTPGLLRAGLVGLVFLPSTGNLYAGSERHAGLGLRLLGVGMAVGGLLALDSGITYDSGRDSLDDGNDAMIMIGLSAFFVGAGTFATGVAVDIVDAPAAARRHNAKHLTLVPMAGRGVTGLALSGTF